MNGVVDRVAQALADSLDDGLSWEAYREQAIDAVAAVASFIQELPLTKLEKTSETDLKMIWSIAADSQRRAIGRYLQAAVKEVSQ